MILIFRFFSIFVFIFFLLNLIIIIIIIIIINLSNPWIQPDPCELGWTNMIGWVGLNFFNPL